MKTKTTNELMKALGVARRSVARIATREKWVRLDNADHGQHIYEVTDAQIKVFLDRPVMNEDARLRMQGESTDFLIGLIDRKLCPVSFNASN
ncbi:hypothetical protein [Nitrosomonas sp.]|uniref:hypothetical protein n=1 Tax=Nitrosomonas sp. TaxID=42353 RepID=UPI0025F05DF6|nr:hypothetical protein [Nitrosomonas sp.]MBY0483469.1 hypothetical protein [Nitrosomonas sp.]